MGRLTRFRDKKGGGGGKISVWGGQLSLAGEGDSIQEVLLITTTIGQISGKTFETSKRRFSAGNDLKQE